MATEEELIKQGWTKRFMADEPRLSESVELYKSLGFEVLLEPLPGKCDQGECRTCIEADIERFRIIYTRKQAGHTADDDLID
ncbi:MAG: hypothetical protein JRJ19_07180 [Deltaproteobacteria bacterium]|nr:hypothetical protein [Deltaproteobacteria bacterium]